MRVPSGSNAIAVAAILAGWTMALPAAVSWAQSTGVNVNLDALGEADPPKANSATKSPPAAATDAAEEIEALGAPQTDDNPAPMILNAAPATASPAKRQAASTPPAPTTQPETTGAPAKPQTPKPSIAAPNEIDFISRTKKTPPSPKSAKTPILQIKPEAAPLDVSGTSDTGGVISQPPAGPSAKVSVNTGALEGVTGTPTAAPSGETLAGKQPSGPLYVPENVTTLPAPIAAPAALSEPPESQLPGTDETAPSALVAPPSTSTTPAIAPAAPQPDVALAARTKPDPKASAKARPDVLAGQATAAEIAFAQGASDLTAEGKAALDALIPPLISAALRVQLAGYSGAPGDNSSASRRLSLSRALSIRDYLAARGVPRAMVNVVAFGGATDGTTDRVDVMIRKDQLSRLSVQ